MDILGERVCNPTEERIKSFDVAVKLICKSCGWSIVWHNFSHWFPKVFKCEKCSNDTKIEQAKRNDVCRLGEGLKRYASPENRQTHYYRNGVLRKKSII